MKYHKPYQKFMAMALAIVITLSNVPISATGVSEGSTVGEITEFQPLLVKTLNQTVPIGAALESLDLPKNLMATVSLAAEPSSGIPSSGVPSSGTTTSEASVPVTWQSSPLYNGTEGTYEFTASVTGYTLATDVSTPKITVTVSAGFCSGTIGGHPLQDGKYYIQSASQTEPATLADTAPTDGRPYLHYSGGVLTVTGSYVINPLNSVGPPISIHIGTLTIAGSGKLTLESAIPCVNFSPNTQLNLSGGVDFTAMTNNTTAPVMYTGSFRTVDGYTGDIQLQGTGAALQSMKEIDLNTTGSITIQGKGSAPIVSCNESIQMTGASVGIRNYDNSNPASNGMLVLGEKDLALTATEGSLGLTASSKAQLVNVRGNITLSAMESINALNYGTDGTAFYWGAATGSSFTIPQAKYVEIYGGVIGNGDQPSLDIQASDRVELRGEVLLGNTGTCTVISSEGDIEIKGEGNRPVFSGKELTLDASKAILVARTNDAGSTIPIIAAASKNLTSKNSMVIVKDNIGSTITTKDGQIISATYGGYVPLWGLELSPPPAEATLYLAGDGYILYTPPQGTTPAVLSLTNATIDSDVEEVLSLPNAAVTMQLSGKNKLRTWLDDGSGIFGYASLTITSLDGGTLDIESPNYAMCFEKAHGSTLTIGGNASVTAVSSLNPAVITGGNLTVEPTAKFVAKGLGADIMIDGAFRAPSFNGSVLVNNQAATPKTLDFTIYGTCDAPIILSGAPVGTSPLGVISLHIPSGSQMTVPFGGQLLITDMTKLKLEGRIVNNSLIFLPVGTTSEQIKAMKLSGTGGIFVPKSMNADGIPSKDGDAYSNEGKPLNGVFDTLRLDTYREIPAFENKGYTWTKSGEGDNEVWTLDVSGSLIRGDVHLPDVKSITIHCAEDAVIGGYIQAGHSYACNLTFTGSGNLRMGSGITNSVGGTITIEDGARVICTDAINFGASGGSNSTLNVIGKGTSLTVSSLQGSAVYCETVNILDGATLNTTADSVGVWALKGVNITGGSTLAASCDYGVYIIGGKLAMDESSKMITNGSIAPFCIVDATSNKEQSAVLSLAGVPSGTEIASVQGSDGAYWSLVKTGGSLQVVDENHEPVTLTGAVQGEKLDFSKIPTYTVTVQNDGNGTASANPTTAKQGAEITLTATPKSGYKLKGWQVISGGVTIKDSRFTMPNGNVTVKATFELANGNNDENTVTVQNDGNGTASANPTTAKQGAKITLTATPKSGYKLKGWQVISGGVIIKDSKFTMPNGNVTVKAIFERISDGDSSSGGNSSDNDTSENTHFTTTNMPTVVTQSSSGAEKNGVLTINITEKMAKDAIAAAQQKANRFGRTANGIAVEFTASNAAGYHSLVINIEEKAIDRLREANVKSARIGSYIFDIALDAQAISEIEKQSSGMVTISAMKQTRLSEAARALIGYRTVFDFSTSYQKNGTTQYISSFSNGTVTLGIGYRAIYGEKSGRLHVVSVDKAGRPQLLTNSSYVDDKVIFKVKAMSIYGVGYKASSAFTDTATHWAKDNIDFVASRNLINGLSSTTFAPNTAITRANLLVALGRLSGADVSIYKASSFTDVKDTDPAMPYIEWAVQNKIAKGIGNNKFDPDQKINRQDMAVMIHKYAKAIGYKLPSPVAAATFSDSTKIAANTKEAVASIQQTGIMQSKGNRAFDPNGYATRAGASTILRRLVELGIDEGTARDWVRNDAGQWQYIGEDGKRTIGWLATQNGKYHYYFTEDGVMVSGKWLQIDGNWYYFYNDGALAKSTKIGGFEVDENGIRRNK